MGEHNCWNVIFSSTTYCIMPSPKQKVLFVQFGKVGSAPYDISQLRDMCWCALQANDGRFEVDAVGGMLTISDVRQDDEGNYVCVVNTTAQPIVTSTNAHLYVESESPTRYCCRFM